MSILAWIYFVSLALAVPLVIHGARGDLRKGEDLTLSDIFLYIALCIVPLVNTVFAVFCGAYFIAHDSKKIVVMKGKQE